MNGRSVLRTLPLLFAVACHPSKKEVAELSAKLDAVAAAQDELRDGLAAQRSRERNVAEPTDDDRVVSQLNTIAEGLEVLADSVLQMAGRLDELEGDLERPRAKAPPRPGRPDPADTFRVEIGKSHVKGPKTALVTIVMWTDYQCPYCQRVQPTMKALENEYGKDVRFVHKHNPLPMHNRAMAAALAAEAAGRQGKFWKMHDALFAGGPRALSDQDLEAAAKKAGLNMGRFRRDLKDKQLEKRIKAEQAQGSKLGARGTPAFFVNGRFLSGAQPVDAFKKTIDEEMDEARKLVRKGTKRSAVYKAVIKNGKTKP